MNVWVTLAKQDDPLHLAIMFSQWSNNILSYIFVFCMADALQNKPSLIENPDSSKQFFLLTVSVNQQEKSGLGLSVLAWKTHEHSWGGSPGQFLRSYLFDPHVESTEKFFEEQVGRGMEEFEEKV